MKANDNPLTEKFILPVPEIRIAAGTEMEIYARFMRHLRLAVHKTMEIRVLSSIQFVADMLNLPDQQVTKILVDMGLRAPRMALPSEYIDYADEALMQGAWDTGAANTSLKELQSHWKDIGEDRLAAFRKFHPSLTIGI